MKKQLVKGFRPVYPTPAAMITSVDADKKPNIITLGEVFNISLGSPPIVGLAIRQATYSHGLISASREFVVNLPSQNIIEQTDYCGTHSGRDVDKFQETGLTAVAANCVSPPLIKECPINLECKVLDISVVGDHDLFIGEVAQAHIAEKILGDDGKIDYAKVDAFCFMFNFGQKGEYWTIGEKIEDSWKSRSK